MDHSTLVRHRQTVLRGQLTELFLSEARLNRPLKNPEQQIPRELELARNDKNPACRHE